jgi:ABC-type transport system involved in Fe-S cluster assembly fused permease/ATPase subunit
MLAPRTPMHRGTFLMSHVCAWCVRTGTLQEALDRIMTSRTSVVVAHRLSTIRNASSIAVVYR